MVTLLSAWAGAVGSVTWLRTGRKPTSVDSARVRLGLTDCSGSSDEARSAAAGPNTMTLDEAETKVRFLIRHGWAGRTSSPFAGSAGIEALRLFGRSRQRRQTFARAED